MFLLPREQSCLCRLALRPVSTSSALKIIQNMKADKFAVLSPRRMSCLYIVYISLKNHIKSECMNLLGGSGSWEKSRKFERLMIELLCQFCYRFHEKIKQLCLDFINCKHQSLSPLSCCSDELVYWIKSSELFYQRTFKKF